MAVSPHQHRRLRPCPAPLARLLACRGPLRPQSTKRCKERTLGRCCALREAACNDSGCLVSSGQDRDQSRHSLCCPLRGPLPKATPRCVLLWGGWRPGLSLWWRKAQPCLEGHCSHDKGPPSPQRETFPLQPMWGRGSCSVTPLPPPQLPWEGRGWGCPSQGWSHTRPPQDHSVTHVCT